MTQAEWIAKHRPRLMGWLAESYATRKCLPSEFGMVVDRQFLALNAILAAMHQDAQQTQTKPQIPVSPERNGK